MIEKDEVYPLRGSGYWVWRHAGPCRGSYFQVHDSASSASRASLRHRGVCREYWYCDELGYDWGATPPDWRAYVGYRGWS